MGDFYAKMSKTGLRLLKKRGMEITLRRTEQGTYDPATGTNATSTVIEYACMGFLASIDSEAANQFYSTSTLRETLIRKEDKMVILSSLLVDGELLGIKPSPITDALVVDGVVYDIVASIPLEPAGVPVLFSLQVRR